MWNQAASTRHPATFSTASYRPVPPQSNDGDGHPADTVNQRTRSPTCWGVRWPIAALAILTLACATMLFFQAGKGELELGHFTYWGIISVALFGCAWLAAMWVDQRTLGQSTIDPGSSYESVVLAVALVPIIAVQGLVVTLITAIPIFDPNILTAITRDIPVGLANFGNIAVHYAPFVILLLALVDRGSHWQRGVRALYDYTGASKGESQILRSWVLFSQAFAFPLFLSGAYSSIFDYNVAYEVDVPHGYIYATGLCFVSVFYALVLTLSRDT